MLLKVTVNGQVFHVDAPNKGTAKAFGKKQLKVEVEELSLADLQALDVSTVEKINVEEKAAPAATGETPAADTSAPAETSGDKTTY